MRDDVPAAMIALERASVRHVSVGGDGRSDVFGLCPATFGMSPWEGLPTLEVVMYSLALRARAAAPGELS